MSCFDLWGPNHAKSAFRTMGYSEAYYTMEYRDKRERLAVMCEKEVKFSSRMADDVSTMKALNSPMARTGRNVSTHILPQRPKPEPGKSQALLAILNSCDQLQTESRALRKRVEKTPSLATQVFRRTPSYPIG